MSPVSRPAGSLVLCGVLAFAAGPAPAPAQQPAERYPTVTISGIVFGHYLYRTDEAADGLNRFDIERAELTAQGGLAERTRYRVSMDVLPPAAGSAGGPGASWTMRARYAYLEHDLTRADAGTRLSARIGMIHNIVIGQQEQFFPRWLHRSPVDRAGYFSSSDLGAGLLLNFPRRLGSAYATVMNGPGLGAPEGDRFKDFGARLTLTPLARAATPFIRSTALTIWGQDGARASQFAAGGAGQVGPVRDPLSRDRWGVHLGVREPALAAGFSWSERVDQVESGANTPDDPRIVDRVTAPMVSIHGHLRPARIVQADRKFPLGLFARLDRISEGPAASDFLLGGLTWELVERTAVAITYQSHQPRASATVARTDAWLFQFTFGF
jgi:hypothetical protein